MPLSSHRQFEAALAFAAESVDRTMDRLLPSGDEGEARLFEAMRYSSLGSGKRLRAFFVLASATLFKVAATPALRTASAIEFVHAYSLIHDDLPAMDDDDLRRGKPSCHKQFDEATAILAGDALQALAFEVLAHTDTHGDPAVRCALVAELAREIGRRDLAVNVAEAAGADGHDAFVAQGFPTLPLPPGTNFTLVHAITRQESQFAQNAISHAGATGLMQLMPGTAREEAERAGMTYMNASLISDADYNIRLGSNHIERLVARYDGSYPLAFAAYNAGPGNVNKWLRANGDPRTGAIGWLEWIEKVPFFETKNYIHRVIENAAVYEQLYPDRTPYGRARTVSDFLR